MVRGHVLAHLESAARYDRQLGAFRTILESRAITRRDPYCLALTGAHTDCYCSQLSRLPKRMRREQTRKKNPEPENIPFGRDIDLHGFSPSDFAPRGSILCVSPDAWSRHSIQSPGSGDAVSQEAQPRVASTKAALLNVVYIWRREGDTATINNAAQFLKNGAIRLIKTLVY
jgi:hypothetical protein